MKKPAAIFLALAALCIAENVFSLGGKEKNTVKTQKVEVSGKVRMVGSSPMTSLVISGNNREWYIEPAEEEKLAELQQQVVTVRAEEYYYDRIFANGISAGRQYFLKNIVIIKSEH